MSSEGLLKRKPRGRPGAGVLLLTADRRYAVLGRTRGKQEWEDFGGRSDPGDVDDFATAIREAIEESRGLLAPLLSTIVGRDDPRVLERVSIEGYICYVVVDDATVSGGDIVSRFAVTRAADQYGAELDELRAFPVAELMRCTRRSTQDSTLPCLRSRLKSILRVVQLPELTGGVLKDPRKTSNPTSETPVCRHFLQSECTRPDCPFRHELPQGQKPKSSTPCRFFLSPTGCSRGDACWYKHGPASGSTAASAGKEPGKDQSVAPKPSGRRPGAGMLCLSHDLTVAFLGQGHQGLEDFGGYADQADATPLATALREAVEETRGALPPIDEMQQIEVVNLDDKYHCYVMVVPEDYDLVAGFKARKPTSRATREMTAVVAVPMATLVAAARSSGSPADSRLVKRFRERTLRCIRESTILAH
jgi:8-oxo-dGTP pyrophosphatase MutT (NUDIX family)